MPDGARDSLQQVVVRMPKEMHEAIKQEAEENDLTMSQVVRAAVRAHLRKAELQLA